MGLVEIVDPIDTYKQSIKAIETLMNTAVDKKETVHIFVQHLHPETYDILEKNAGKTTIRLMLVKDISEEVADNYEKIDIKKLKDEGIEVTVINKNQLDLSYLPSDLPKLCPEYWITPSNLVYLYPHA